MREILFKAKRVDNGKWVEGYYYKRIQEKEIVDAIEKCDGTVCSVEYYQIITETLCQYTGLTDKNGNKIWENDIIQYKDIKALGKVEYIEDSFCLNDVDDGKQYIEGMWNKFEVIGNIFDNLELLQ